MKTIIFFSWVYLWRAWLMHFSFISSSFLAAISSADSYLDSCSNSISRGSTSSTSSSFFCWFLLKSLLTLSSLLRNMIELFMSTFCSSCSCFWNRLCLKNWFHSILLIGSASIKPRRSCLHSSDITGSFGNSRFLPDLVFTIVLSSSSFLALKGGLPNIIWKKQTPIDHRSALLVYLTTSVALSSSGAIVIGDPSFVEAISAPLFANPKSPMTTVSSCRKMFASLKSRCMILFA